MSEREIEEIAEVKKEGDDGWRWKVMARLETDTHTHAHSHKQVKNSRLDFSDQRTSRERVMFDPAHLQNFSKTNVIRVFPQHKPG